MNSFVSRAGQKLNHALDAFGIDVGGLVCADLGSNTGGFVDCLLQRGAAKVYAVEKGYGVLDYKLRKNPRVVVMERTNAMHVELTEKVDFVSVDVSWTRQKNILPAARRLLKPAGTAVVLIKPHYEAQAAQLRKGVLLPEHVEGEIKCVEEDLYAAGLELFGRVQSPIRGTGGNVEFLARLRLGNDRNGGAAQS
jgi:23S rRNA (cytidine1920-2'-O)/16S rRNA (cytidine1409-2'-O)-methyltransferase